MEAFMNLVDLIFVACSLTDPTSCKEQHLLFEGRGSLSACAMQAQPYLAQWIGEHPNLRVTRWRCAWPDAEDRPT
jgi:hypothetical protein